MTARKIGVTELVLRDAHQSLMATRMAMEDMVDACEDIDKAGYWSVECWGGATFDACIRFLNEDPWKRLRTFRELLPSSRLQMLLRGQNLLGYRHYNDEVVDRFVDKSAENITHPEDQEVIILHADAPQDAAKLDEMLKAKVPGVRTRIECVGPVIGAHCGPGTVAICFLGKERAV